MGSALPVVMDRLSAACAPVAPFDVLLIEDDLVDELATLRAIAAQDLPYRVQMVRSVAQARSVLGTRRFDVILADYQLPDGRSFDLFDVFADQLVIFVTGAWDAAAANQALQLGVHDYLIKDTAGNYLKLLHYRVQTALRQRALSLALRESETRLRSILDHAPALVTVHDLNGRLLLSNRHHGLTSASDSPSAAAPASADALPVPLADPIEGEEILKHADGSLHTYLTVRFAIPAACGAPAEVGAISVDITARKQAEAQVRNLAFYDPLTNLPNRRMLLDRLLQACATSARHGSRGAVFFIDLDHFKELNDTLGHDHGDMLLKVVAARLQAAVRAEDTVARLGGDEFVVMTVGLDSTPEIAALQASVVGQKLVAALSEPATLGRHRHTVTPSIGVTVFMGREATPEQIIKRADVAMYQAKAAGRGTLRYFDPDMQAGLQTRALLEADLRGALGAGQFCLHFQRQVEGGAGGAGHVVGAEALLRWRHPERGLMLPAQFLPLAEQSGLIVPMGRWVIERACAQLAQWARHPGTRGLRIAVNVSTRQFRDEGFVDSVLLALQQAGADPRLLWLELRESLVQDNPARTLRGMDTLRAAGVGFVLDDFGVSSSSLALLERLPLSELKIARSLMTSITSDRHHSSVVRTILGVADGLGLRAAASGVETTQQLDLLRGLGCTRWQGRHFGAPLPVLEFEASLARSASA